MRHLDIRDMWLQSEVLTGKVILEKVSGVRNPADLMTKVLGSQDVVGRLDMLNMSMYDPLGYFRLSVGIASHGIGFLEGVGVRSPLGYQASASINAVFVGPVAAMASPQEVRAESEQVQQEVATFESAVDY